MLQLQAPTSDEFSQPSVGPGTKLALTRAPRVSSGFWRVHPYETNCSAICTDRVTVDNGHITSGKRFGVVGHCRE